MSLEPQAFEPQAFEPQDSGPSMTRYACMQRLAARLPSGGQGAAKPRHRLLVHGRWNARARENLSAVLITSHALTGAFKRPRDL